MNIRIIRRLLVLSVMAFLAAGCNIIPPGGCSSQAVQGSGEVVAEDRNVSTFNEIKLKGMGNVILSKGESQSVEIVTDDNIMPLIETTVQGKKLIISYKKNNIKPTTLDFLITVADLKGVSISGSGDITGKSRFLSDNFYADISGSGDCKVKAAETLTAKISGSGDVFYKGQPQVNTSISGSGSIKSRN